MYVYVYVYVFMYLYVCVCVRAHVHLSYLTRPVRTSGDMIFITVSTGRGVETLYEHLVPRNSNCKNCKATGVWYHWCISVSVVSGAPDDLSDFRTTPSKTREPLPRDGQGVGGTPEGPRGTEGRWVRGDSDGPEGRLTSGFPAKGIDAECVDTSILWLFLGRGSPYYPFKYTEFSERDRTSGRLFSRTHQKSRTVRPRRLGDGGGDDRVDRDVVGDGDAGVGGRGVGRRLGRVSGAETTDNGGRGGNWTSGRVSLIVPVGTPPSPSSRGTRTGPGSQWTNP